MISLPSIATRDVAAGDLITRVAHHRVGERTLAGAVRPHQGVNLALVHLQVDAGDDLFTVDRDAGCRRR